MRKPKIDWPGRIPSQTTRETRSRYNLEVIRQVDQRELKFFKAQVTKEAITNAILLHFLDLPQEQKDAIFDRYIPKVEAMVALPTENPAPMEAGIETTQVGRSPKGRLKKPG